MTDHFVPTKCAQMKTDAASDFKVITYESYKRKPKTTSLAQPIRENVGLKDTRKGIDIQRARREVIKFGVTGFSAEKQQEAKIAHAISLGARPPKKEYKNYKELMQEKQKQKLLEKKSLAFQQIGKNAVGASTAKKKFIYNKAHGGVKKHKGEFLDMYGKATLDTTKKTPAKKIHKRKR